MKVRIEEIENLDDIEIVIRCSSVNDDVKKLVYMLDKGNDTLLCKQDKELHQVHIKDVMYIESIDEKTFVYLDNEVYENQNKLYEVEDLLKDKGFVRISKSVVLNLDELKCVKALLNGKYEATLLNGEKLIINRSYMSSFKEAMGI